MVKVSELKQGMKLYMYNRYNHLKRCDVFVYPGSPTGFGFIHEDYPDTMYWLTEKELRKMFKSREEAEQFDLFQLEEE